MKNVKEILKADKAKPQIFPSGTTGGRIRQFTTGATRDTEDEKPDYEGFISPLVLQCYAAYMHKHRRQSDRSLRASDNWQKGIPLDVYMKSSWRHFMDWWMEHRHYGSRDGLTDALCGLLFNTMGYLHEILMEQKMSVADNADDVGSVVYDENGRIIGHKTTTERVVVKSGGKQRPIVNGTELKSLKIKEGGDDGFGGAVYGTEIATERSEAGNEEKPRSTRT